MFLPFEERLTCTVRDALEATSIGRTTLYGLIKRGQIKTAKLGTRTLIDVKSLKELTSNYHRK
ncbi:helix-turn-helix domain-containing protein [Lichenifustis flavocetrariae]|uniref:Helix-turn-helix domain-containing protein n=1 Tax=Lichenifustis flavocetrariae TaxID=2949735 RepID=A0AA41Z7W4_9HYPH|nr:helix-turn-helix domain-containing protein [Lichenifustis flavocetrariae]MCW6512128.1 helix-turn-helix domain-containing protein [Lichenifustis flavocetrariae]